jgi:tRNA threonylcarbamoyladenosine biosynthesis protein TsaB
VPLLLALETATPTCGVALLRTGDEADGSATVVAEAHLHRPRVHGARLAPLVRDVLAHAEASPAALDAVAVSEGPGSFTGLRIGVSTAKGLAWAAGAALVGVPTLEALAATLAPVAAPGDRLVAALDARRDDVYAAAFRRPPTAAAPDDDAPDDDAPDDDAPTDRPLAPLAAPAALPVDALPDWLAEAGPEDANDDANDDAEAGRLWLVGSGAAKAARVLPGAVVLPPAVHPPSAAWVGRLAARRLAAGTVADLASFEPAYLKRFHGTKP